MRLKAGSPGRAGRLLQNSRQEMMESKNWGPEGLQEDFNGRPDTFNFLINHSATR